MANKLITILYFLVRIVNQWLRRKDAELVDNREKAIEIIKDPNASKADKLRALRDLSK